MGPLTESMTRLCGEIKALRGARLTFVRNLAQDVASQKAEFRRAHNLMAQTSRAERRNFVKALENEVASMRAGFRRAHKEMARNTKTARRAALAHLKQSVGAMRQDFAQDLAGAHRAWFGPSPQELQAQAEAKRRALAAEQQRAKEAAERERLIAQTMAQGAPAEPAVQSEHKEETHRPGKKKG
ncbi:hypothetical protein [Desulfobacca acetoxidans]|uniref:Uncharacterized protein n=1 Tax=Desulfobacca acetoxidans (strain ATCC 700848 / DSM 11109 / ASRB2) TaxID=880072 RepID=F2NI03_DESAR|nr:hypothetical protein [Desulfobacca acetoxidans]AEB09629.1 hypothetical protein Desac_1789 [Desulfobacca acetoxidans DSM 11109]